MVLIADSGSTKCTWIASDGARTTNVRTRGINAVQHSAEQIREALAELPPCDGVTSVRFYGAGCGETFPEASEKLRRELEAHFGTTDITVESDLLGAVRALWGRGEGIACILGTGSNSCLCCNGEILKNVPPLGYVLGDEGSGAVLGRNLVNGIFKGHIPLKEEFLAAHGLNYEEIIRRVYREPYANRFLASFAPFIRAHIDRPEIRELVLRSFRDFRVPQPEPLSGGTPRIAAGRRGGPLRGVAARGAGSGGPPRGNHCRIARRRAFEIPLWKIESPNRIRPTTTCNGCLCTTS